MFRIAIACALLAGCSEELATTELPACGQFRDGHWDQRLVSPGVSGLSARVTAIVRLPDGSVIAGGSFETMSGVGAHNIARWNGTTWSPLGPGLPGAVRSLAVDDLGQLWAVGEDVGGSGPLDGFGGKGFGSSYLARWNGTQWTTVVDDVFTINGVTAVEGGVAVYGSFFQIVGGVSASGIAIWRDGVWSALGITGSAGLQAATRHGSGLCAAGQIQTTTTFINGIACWNGSTWTQLGDEVTGVSTIVQGKDGDWYVGGTLSVFDENNERFGIARLEDDQHWHALDGGIHAMEVVLGGGAAFTPQVTSISVDGDDLVVAGHFEWVGVPKVRAYNLARWSPTTGWTSMTPPSDLFAGTFGGLSAVLATNEQTYVGGSFPRIGLRPGAGIATIAGGNAHAIPESTLAPVRLGAITDMIAMPDGLVMAGRFKETVEVDGPPAPLQSLLHFDGEWSPIDGVPVDFSLTAASLGDDGYAVRSGETLYRLLTGQSWQVVTDQPVSGPLVADGDGTLFFVIPTQPYSRIIKSSRNDTSFYALVPGTVIAMAIYQGELVVVTSNDLLGGQSVYRRRDDEWELIGAWSDYTNSLVVSPALGLVAGTQGGTRVWNGTEWRTTSHATVYDMAACSDGVLAAIDEGDGSRLAFLDDPDDEWKYFGEPRGAQWWQITPTDRGIYIGTSFAGEGGISADSPMGFARWTTLDDTGW